MDAPKEEAHAPAAPQDEAAAAPTAPATKAPGYPQDTAGSSAQSETRSLSSFSVGLSVCFVCASQVSRAGDWHG